MCVTICFVPGLNHMTAVLQSHWLRRQAPHSPGCRAAQQPHLWPDSNRAWHFTCWLCVPNFIIYALCPYNWQKNAAWWSKPTVERVGQGHEDRACNTNDLQTFAYFTGSCAQLPSKSPVLPPEVIVPGWLGDRCQVAPPQAIHHAKQRRKADLRLSLSLVLSLCFSL